MYYWRQFEKPVGGKFCARAIECTPHQQATTHTHTHTRNDTTMVGRLIEHPHEDESVFSRGRESSTLSVSVDDPTLAVVDTNDDEEEEESDSYNYGEHLFPQNHQAHNNRNMPKPPRHPKSFNETGRVQKDRQGYNPFATSTNPFDTDSSRDLSDSMESNSLSEQQQQQQQPKQPEPQTKLLARMASPTNNPFDETSSSASQRSTGEPRKHSWDSDRQFPVLEIERIKRKTRKLKGQGVATPQDVDQAFQQTPHFQPRPYHPVARVNDTATIRRGNSFPANDSLAEVLDQPTVGTNETGDSYATPRSRTSELAEKELIKSFQKTGRRPRADSTSRGSLGSTSPSINRRSAHQYHHPRPRNRPYHDEKKEADVAPILKAKSSGSHKTFSSLRRASSVDEDRTTAETSHETSHDYSPNEDLDLTLHDLCAEAATADDIAWRNALCLLAAHPNLGAVVDPNAEQFTPLHVCCLGDQAPPSFIILGLLYAYPQAVRKRDAGGRLPLHLVAASSADVTTMQWLVNEYPEAVSQTDDFGLTPLHLYLRRLSDEELDPQRVSILLGCTDNGSSAANGNAGFDASAKQDHILFRRGSHMHMSPDDVREQLVQRPRPVTRFTRVDHEAAIANYPPDIQVSLRQLSRWQTKMHSPARSKDVNVTHSTLVSSFADAMLEMEDDLGQSSVSPAAIETPSTGQLPIHMVVQRIIEEQEQHGIQIHNSTEEYEQAQDEEVQSSPLKQRSDSEDEDSEVEDLIQDPNNDAERPKARRASHLADPKILEVMRLIIDDFSEGLSVRDGEGFTPLLKVLMNGEEMPNLDVVLLLLGRRSCSANKEWSVDQDLPLHQLSAASVSSMWVNPAMVPSTWTKQLPLHIVAEEYASELPLVQSVYEAYPAAIQVQDSHGRTPLHLALSSYRDIPVDPRVMNMLLSDIVAQTQDRKGMVPLDIMLENAHVLPETLPWAWKLAEANDPAVGTVYQRLFHASMLHLASSTTSRANGREILHSLQVLPQWMRRQACVSTFVQEVLVEEIATPWKSAVILLDGVLLIGLLTVFRLQMNEYIVSGQYLDTWYTFAVYAFATGRFLLLGAMGSLASSLGQYNDMVLRNLWYWIDYAAMVLAIVTSVLLNGSVRQDILLSLGTGATGLLWWSVIGYISRWSLAMSVFAGLLGQLANYIFYVLVAFGAVIVAFGQMLYTVFQTNCEGAIVQSSVCSVRDSYRVIYLLLRGESLGDETGAAQMSPQAISMVVTFLFFVCLVLIGLFAIIVLVTGHADVDDLARRSYWEPMMAYVMSMNSLGMCGRSHRRTCGDSLSGKLGVLWDALTFRYTGRETAKANSWFIRPCYSWLLTTLSVLIIPVWFVLGLATLGFLWPPQLRRALFRPSTLWQRRRSVGRGAESTSQQINALRSETLKFKVLSYDRMVSMEKELRDLKDLLAAALTDHDEQSCQPAPQWETIVHA